MEIHAHDPVKFVSDMLAWVHQAVASEKEFSATVLHQGKGGGRGACAMRISINSACYECTIKVMLLLTAWNLICCFEITRPRKRTL